MFTTDTLKGLEKIRCATGCGQCPIIVGKPRMNANWPYFALSLSNGLREQALISEHRP
jgi:hypothetical protein